METPEFEDALFEWVKTQPTVTQYIGAPPQRTRMFVMRQPQNTKAPSMTQQRAGLTSQRLPCGVDGAKLVQLQVDSYADHWAEMAGLAKAFRRALEGLDYPVLMGSGDSPGAQLRVKSATLQNEFDSDDPEPGLYRRTQFWDFWIFEP